MRHPIVRIAGPLGPKRTQCCHPTGISPAIKQEASFCQQTATLVESPLPTFIPSDGRSRNRHQRHVPDRTIHFFVACLVVEAPISLQDCVRRSKLFDNSMI
jgi:hypothetical protein